ncbi:MAG TPA: sugar transferase [bacterium]|nr:sugar transferase [bacterium]
MNRKAISMLAADAVLINLCIVSVFSIRFLGSVPARNIAAYYLTWYYITALFVAIFYVQGLYDFDENDDGMAIFFKVLSSAALGIICLMALSFVSRAFAFPRTVIGLSFFVILSVLSCWHLFVHNKFLSKLPPTRVLILGDAERIQHIESCIRKQIRRFEHVASFGADMICECKKMLSSAQADGVIITDRINDGREIALDFFISCPKADIYLMPDVSDIVTGARHQIVMGDIPLISISKLGIIGRFSLIKRSIDIFLSFIAIAVLSPVFVLVALSVKLTSKGSVFYTQNRVGKDGKIFKIIKFRTMVQNAEEPTGPMLAIEADPRITKVGRILRDTKIDEAPQLINILKGEMSIVGPRPERPEFVEVFENDNPAYAKRKLVRPGLTGLAQVNGRYETDPSVKLKYDLLYIYNYKISNDFQIMYETLQFIVRSNAGFND